MNPIAAKIEALLFSEGESVTLKRLSQLLEVPIPELYPALDSLEAGLSGRGVTLVRTDLSVALAVSAEAGEVVRKAHDKELSRDVGDAGLEVLAIVLYRGPTTRAQIDYIRGVNTSSTVRNLLSRGLIERAENPLDSREYLYRPTPELLAHLGVEEAKKLPEYASIANELTTFEARGQSLDHNGQSNTPSDDATGN